MRAIEDQPANPRPHSRARLVLTLWTLLAVLATGPSPAQLKPVFTGNVVTGDFLFPIEVAAGDLDGDGDIDLVGANDEMPGEDNSSIVWWTNEDGAGTNWTEHTIVAQFNGARTVRTVDMDRDGDLDVLAAGSAADAVRWWENVDGTGLVWSSRTIVAGLDGAIAAFPGDIDGDGDIDVASGAFNVGGVRWHENLDGVGTSWAVREISFSYDAPRAVNVADIDGDGDLDVVACSEFDDLVTWWTNLDGDGTVWQERGIDAAIDAPTALRAGDVDGDGDTDVVAAAGGADAVYLWRNLDGDGLTWSRVTVDDTLDLPNWVEIHDMDADGDLDVLGTARADDFVRWWENIDGDGTSWIHRTVSNSFDGATSVVAADIDGDGLTDLAATAGFGDDIMWWNNGALHRNASFPAATTISDVASDAHEAFSADLDGDGDPDLLVASGGDNTIYWYETQSLDPPTYVQRIVTNVADGATGVWAADLDGDGDIDVISTAVNDDAVSWHENDGGSPPTFFRRDLSLSAVGAVTVTAADLDRDGDVDVVSGSRADDTIRWFENDGNEPPAFTVRIVTATADSVRGVRVADVNGDGDPDILSASRNDDTVRWHENEGGTPPAFTERVISTTTDGARAVAAADLDRDGDLDVIVAAELAGEVVWFENDGSPNPTFTEQTLPGTVSGAISVATGDVDSDGDVDILAAARDGGEIFFFESTGTTPPTFAANLIEQGASLVQSVITSDIDRDGDPDIVASTLSDYRLAHFENCGGQFGTDATATTARTIPQGGSDDVLTIEISHRGRGGDFDLAMEGIELLFESTPGVVLTTADANNFIDRLEVYLDDGSGVFEPSNDSLVAQALFLALTDGRLSLDTAGNPDFEVGAEASATYFVVPVLRPDAASQPVHQFVLTHLAAEGGPQPSAVISGFPTPLALECGTDVSTPIVVASAYELTTVGSCPGPVQVSISGTDPDAQIGLLVSVSEGSFQKPSPPCQGLELGLGAPTFVRLTTTDANGEVTLMPTLNETHCGLFLQAADLATCRVSNVAQLP